jgi:hypothetical protein
MPEMGPATLRGSISLAVGERKPDGSPPVLVKFNMQGAKTFCGAHGLAEHMECPNRAHPVTIFNQQERRPLVSRCSVWMCTTWYVFEKQMSRWQAAGFACSRLRHAQFTIVSLSPTLQAYKPFKGVKYIMEGGDYEVRKRRRNEEMAFLSTSTRPFHSPPC